MIQQHAQLARNQSAQQFLSQQFCSKSDRVRLQNLIPVALHENCFQKKYNEFSDPSSRLSPPHIFAPVHGIRPSQKPSQPLHKPNMSLQGKGNGTIDQFQEKLSLFNRKRDYSPNSEALRSLMKSTSKEISMDTSHQSRRPQSMNQEENMAPYNLTPNNLMTKFISKSPSPLEIKESVANLLTNHFRTDTHSPKGQGTHKPKVCGLQLGPYLSIQQSKSSQKSKGHSSANSVSYGPASLAKQINSLMRKDTTQTPTKFTTTMTSEHSKSKSVVDNLDQTQYKENDYNHMNIGTPSTFLTSKISLDQNSLEGSSQNRIQKGTTQQSPPFQKTMAYDQLQESFPVRTCINHKTKKAKYLNEDQSKITYYCSKCAVKLASQGLHFSEIAMNGSIESQALSFQMSSQDSNRQITQAEAQFKEKEMIHFLQQLQTAQMDRQELLSLLQAQSTKISNWYDSQMKQCDESKQTLASLVNEAHSRAVGRLQTSKQQAILQIQNWFNTIAEQQTDSRNIQNDIERNWSGVLEGIDMEPFRKIMAYYSSKFHQMFEGQQQLVKSHIQLNQLAQSDLQATMALIAQNFELLDSSIPVIKMQNNNNQQQQQNGNPIRTQPTPPKKREETPTVNRVKTDFSNHKQALESPQNFFQYFFDQGNEQQQQQQSSQSHQKYQQYSPKPQNMIDSKQSCRALPATSVHNNNLYVSFENKDIFMNALDAERNKQSQSDDDELSSIRTCQQQHQNIMILQSYRGSQTDIEEEDLNSSQESPKSTPHSPASGQTKQIVQRTASKTPEQDQLPKEAFQKQKNTFRTLFDTQADEPQIDSSNKNDRSISPAKSEKFKDILNRISSNQSKTQQFYQQIINSNSKIISETPDIKKYELQDTETCKKAVASNKQSIDMMKDSIHQMNLCDDQQDLSDYENDEDKEVQAMFSSKEMKYSEKKQLTVPSESSHNTSHNMEIKKDPYQKTLFCSPTFKDQDILNISDSSCDGIN